MASLGDKFKNFWSGKSNTSDSNFNDPIGNISDSNSDSDGGSDDGGDFDGGGDVGD